jgi:nitroreductase
MCEEEFMMNFLQLATEQRYSVRKFTNDKIEAEQLDLILEAGRIAPTAANYQPQRILVLDSEENLTKLKSCTPYHFNAPLALLICYDSGTCWKHMSGKGGGDIDASIVTTHMMLEAASLGIGSTWVGAFDFDKARELFHIPDYIIPVAILPLGYPASDSKPNPMHDTRFNLEHSVYYNSFEEIARGEVH